VKIDVGDMILEMLVTETINILKENAEEALIHEQEPVGAAV
jgi:hypothetical protein